MVASLTTIGDCVRTGGDPSDEACAPPFWLRNANPRSVPRPQPSDLIGSTPLALFVQGVVCSGDEIVQRIVSP